jgi:hypothetical protein
MVMHHVVIIDLGTLRLAFFVYSLRSKRFLVHHVVALLRFDGRVRVLDRGRLLLQRDGSRQLTEEVVGLLEQMRDTSVFGGIDELHVSLFVVCL